MLNNILKTTAILSLLATIHVYTQPLPVVAKSRAESSAKESYYNETRYRPIVDSLLATYKKKQYLFNLKSNSSRFYYKIVPITLFPFFCGGITPDKQAEIIYTYGLSYSMYRIIDDGKRDHAQVGVESYVQDGIKCPAMKVYRLHYFLYNQAFSVWQEEGAPKEILLELTNQKGEMYGCRTARK
jgi:hypothetical protein